MGIYLPVAAAPLSIGRDTHHRDILQETAAAPGEAPRGVAHCLVLAPLWRLERAGMPYR